MSKKVLGFGGKGNTTCVTLNDNDKVTEINGYGISGDSGSSISLDDIKQYIERNYNWKYFTIFLTEDSLDDENVSEFYSYHSYNLPSDIVQSAYNYYINGGRAVIRIYKQGYVCCTIELSGENTNEDEGVLSIEKKEVSDEAQFTNSQSYLIIHFSSVKIEVFPTGCYLTMEDMAYKLLKQE